MNNCWCITWRCSTIFYFIVMLLFFLIIRRWWKLNIKFFKYLYFKLKIVCELTWELIVYCIEEVLLENVELILEAFDYLELPFALKHGIAISSSYWHWSIYPTLFNGNRSWSLIKEKFIKRNEIIKDKNIISLTGKLSKGKIPSLQFKVEVSSTSSYLCISENATLCKSNEWSEHYIERKLQGYNLKFKSVVPVHIDACLKVQPFGKIMNEPSIT
jgi:hypothetical protein